MAERIAHVDLQLAPGRRLAVLGRSGAGKSTLLAALLGSADRLGGRWRLQGRQMRTGRGAGRVALMPAPGRRFEAGRVADCLRLAAPDAKSLARLQRCLPVMRIEAEADADAAALTPLDKALLALGCALAGEPALLLLDAPLAGLAPVERYRFLQVLEALDGEATADGLPRTVVIADRCADLALAYADEALVLDAGQVAWQGNAAELARAAHLSEIRRLAGAPV